MNTLWLPDRRKPRNHSRNSLRSVGSGPRGRRFKSSRPDHFLEHSRNSDRWVTRFLLRISTVESSARRFKSLARSRLFGVSNLSGIGIIGPHGPWAIKDYPFTLPDTVLSGTPCGAGDPSVDPAVTTMTSPRGPEQRSEILRRAAQAPAWAKHRGNGQEEGRENREAANALVASGVARPASGRRAAAGRWVDTMCRAAGGDRALVGRRLAPDEEELNGTEQCLTSRAVRRPPLYLSAPMTAGRGGRQPRPD
jgi:hypothetical protein